MSSGLSFISKDKQVELEKKTEEATQEDFTPVFRFVITSDVHIQANSDTNAERLADFIQTAYRYSESHPSYNTLDAILLAGDNCDRGTDEEYEILKRVVKENIREESQLVTIMGNHEFGGTGLDGY